MVTQALDPFRLGNLGMHTKNECVSLISDIWDDMQFRWSFERTEKPDYGNPLESSYRNLP